MSDLDTQLLCTFSTEDLYKHDAHDIGMLHHVVGNRIYVLANEANTSEVFLTYNIVVGDTIHRYPKTISVHRKKDFNVLYSINALNELVKSQNSGNISPSITIDWAKCRNSIIVVKDGSVVISPTKLKEILYLSR